MDNLIQILEPLRLTPELSGLNYILTRLAECFRIAKKVNWPFDLQNQLESQSLLLDKVLSSSNFHKVIVFPSKNPIYRRITYFPVAALFCQSFSPSLTLKSKESLLFVQYLIFLILFNCKSTDELIASSCNELRKLISEENKLSIVITFTKLDQKILVNIFDLLIEKGKVNFQRQLSTTWRDFIHSKIKAKKILPPDSGATDKAPQNSQVTNRVRKASTTLNSAKKTKNHQGYTTKQNTEYIPIDNNSEVDNNIFETVELTLQKGIALDRRTKQANILSQNRLSVIEQKLLCWRSNALAFHEVNELAAFIKQKLRDKESRGTAIYCCLLMLTSKPYAQLNSFVITGKVTFPLVDDNIIELSSGSWWRRSIKMPDCFIATDEQKKCLFKHSEFVALPLPIEIVEAVNSLNLKNVRWLDELCDMTEPRAQLADFLSLFKQSAKNIYRTITPAAVRSVSFNKLANKFNEGVAALLLANSEYTSPTILYYLSVGCETLQLNYQALLNDLNFSHLPLLSMGDAKVGSQLAIDTVKMKGFIKDKITFLKNDNITSTDVESLVSYHNHFVNYLTLMLLAATGHRKRSEYGFSEFTINEKLGYILLADKINYADSAIRVIPISKMLSAQITSYRHHCVELARKLKGKPVVQQALAKVSSQHTYDSPLLFHIKNNSIAIIGSQDIETYLQPEINLPNNFFRHHLCSSLVANQYYDFMASFMGHMGNGTHILSDFSCLKLSHLKPAALAIDTSLNALGFEHIKKQPAKGRIVTPSGKIGVYYKTNFLCRSENKEVSEQIKWVRKLIKPHIEQLLNMGTRDKTIQHIDSLARSAASADISLERRLYWVNRWLSKLVNNNRWVSTNTPEHELYLETDLLVMMNESEAITKCINRWLISNQNSEGALSWIAKLWVSINLNSHYTKALSKPLLSQLISPPYRHKSTGLAWYQFGTKANPQCVYLDSLSQILCLNRPKVSTNKVSVATVNKYIKKTILLKLKRELLLSHQSKTALNSIFTLMKLINPTRHEDHLPLLDAHKNKRINTTAIQPENAIRWLSQGQYAVENNALSQLAQITPYSRQKMMINTREQFSCSLALINKLHAALNQLIEGKESSKAQTEALILSIWANHIGCKGVTNIDALIESSNNLDNVMVLILVWLVDVAKRPGKENRKKTAPSTVKTYLSNIGKPLLEQSIGVNFINLNSEELTELYKNAHESRNVKDKAQRAASFRRFHYFNKELFGLDSVNWYEVEPSIDKQIQNVNANLISMTEYENAQDLLRGDSDHTPRERRINQLLLTLCYRAGLRSGEAMYLKTGDIDTNNWILHIRSHQGHRLKTLKSNRRIPVSLLFCEAEKTLMLEQLTEAKQRQVSSNENWLFCDFNNPYFLVERHKHVQRTTEAIKIATGDMSIRLHNSRHSFANYLLMLLVEIDYPPLINKEVTDWLRADEFNKSRNDLRSIFLGCSTHSFNALYAVSVAMGHSTPKTTLSNYIHCLDLLVLAQDEQRLYQQIHIPELAKLINIERTNVNHILKRNNTALYGLKPLINRIQFRVDDYFDVSLATKTVTALPVIAANYEINNYNTLNNIERIIRAAEDNYSTSEIMDMYQLSYQIVSHTIDEALKLKLTTAYVGINLDANSEFLIFSQSSQNVDMISKFIRQPEFQMLLKQAAALSNKQLLYLSNIFIDSYNNKHGIVLSSHATEQLKMIVMQLGYQAVIAEELTGIRNKFGIRKGYICRFVPLKSSQKKYIREHYNDKRLTHCLFLIAILTSTLNIGDTT